MGTHLWRFLGAAWKLLRNSLSTSNLSIIIFSVCAPIALFLALVVLEWSKGSRTSSSFVAALGESTKTALLTAGVAIFLWLSLFRGLSISLYITTTRIWLDDCERSSMKKMNSSKD